MKCKKPHYINILQNIEKYVLLLIFPTIRGLVLYKQDFYTWIKGTWFDIIIILIIFYIGYIRWNKTKYYINNQRIIIEKGVFVKSRKFILFKDICSSSIEIPFYFKPINAVKVFADTNAGKHKKKDIYLTLKKQDAIYIMSKISKNSKKNIDVKRTYSPRFFYIAIISFFSSNSINGVIFISTLILQSQKILGKDFKDKLLSQITSISETVLLDLSYIPKIIIYIIAIGWAISFILNIIRYKGFCVNRYNKNINIKSGSIVERNYLIDTNKINYIEIKQSIITKFFGLISIFINISGYGKDNNSSAILIPSTIEDEAFRNLSILLPEFDIAPKQIKPDKKTFKRFIIPPISTILCGVIGLILLLYLFPNFKNSIFFIGIMFQIPCIWWLIVKIISFFHTGIGKINKETYTFYRTFAFGIYTNSINYKKITKITIKQSIFQKSEGICNVCISKYSESKKIITIPNLNTDEVYKIFNIIV